MARRATKGGKAGRAKARKAGPTKRRASTKPGRRKVTPVKRGKGSSVADLKRQLKNKIDDLATARDQQAASAEVLHVISSSPGDVAPVFDAMLENAMRLCEASHCHIWRFDGGLLHAVAVRGDPWFTKWLMEHNPVAPIPGSAADCIVRGEDIVHVADRRQEKAYSSDPIFRGLVDTSGVRASLSVALRREGMLLGMINVYRQEVRPFSDRQIALLQTFADQAVIAIENARLFNETKEALARQTATSDVLRVISSSPGELQPVFDAMLENATRICAAKCGILYRCSGDALRTVATHGAPRSFVEERQRNPIVRPNPDTTLGRALSTKQPIQIADILAEVKDLDDRAAQLPKLAGARTVLAVPMVKGNELLGAILIYRQEVCLFTDKQVELVENFAAQAAIAIENTRLFNETREALERQTATADVLKVIASSPSRLQPVFDAIAERSNELMHGHSTTVFRFVGDMVELAAFTPVEEEADAVLRAAFPRRLSTVTFDSILRGEIAETIDAASDSEPETSRTIARARGFRSRLVVPLRSDDGIIGAISITRKEPGAFADKDKELLRTFADQAVIAIQNVELFEQVQARTRELSQSLDDLRAAQDRLVQTEKLASLGQLTAGIAHEIKNPLNFVNNFSALSIELTGELDDVLRQAEVAEKVRQEVGELTQLLKSNLEKVVQHGKRADSIVKNMLLHSREGSGERRSVEINALVEESLNLAYHGSRAERSDFQITLERDLDPGAGQVELYPQEITRALLNMISNGFYAATRRARETGNSFEPTLSAATRGLSDRVEIRIRDNGTGIPPEVLDKMFNPFFTTKPAGEGTGLGLSMSHDIIVKQHGGTIDVETQPGRFTEIIIALPRASHLRQKPA